MIKAAAWLFLASVVLGPLSYGPAARGLGAGYVGAASSLLLVYGFPWLFSSDIRASRAEFPKTLTRLSYITMLWAPAMALLAGVAVTTIDEPLGWYEVAFVVATMTYAVVAMMLAFAFRRPAARTYGVAVSAAGAFLALLTIDLVISLYQLFASPEIPLMAALSVFAGKGFRLFQPALVFGVLVVNREHRLCVGSQPSSIAGSELTTPESQ